MSKYIKASGMIEVIEMLRWSKYLDKNSTLNLLVRAIEQSPTDTVDAIEVPTWIPVTERLPELRKDVLVYDGEESVGNIVFMRVWSLEQDTDFLGNTSGEYVWWDDERPYDLNAVTHWMPLPDAPKDGDA